MIPTISGNPLYTGHLKGNDELYVTNDQLIIIHQKKGNRFTMNLSDIRCAFPISHDVVRIFWRATKSKGDYMWTYWNRYQKDFKLDLKKSFPDKKERQNAEKTESKKLTNLILHAIQQTHSINKPNMKGYLAMHTGEYLMSSHMGQCKFGKGDVLITNLGVYFVTFDKGLCFDMPLDLLDSYDFKNKTVKIHYYEPMWQDGRDEIHRKNHNIEIRVTGSAQDVVYSISKACTGGGVKEIRTLAKYADIFGNMASDEIYAQYFSGKHGVFKEIDDYLAILAKRKWGVPPTPEIGLRDAKVVLACLCAGVSLDVAGNMTAKDKQFRENIVRYHTQYEEYIGKCGVLLTDIMDIVTKNLESDDSEKIQKQCNPFIIFDTVKEIAKNGSIPESFNPDSLIEWIQFKNEVNTKITQQKLLTMPYGYDFEWTDDIFCPWSVEDAKRIVSDTDFLKILKSIELLNAQYPDIDKFQPSFMYAKTFEMDHCEAIKVRVRRVYDRWCESNPLSGLTNPADRKWVKHLTDNLNETNLEIRRDHFGSELSAVEEIRDLEMESQNIKSRLERTKLPDKIPVDDVYGDAWFDQNYGKWFTTNPYFRIEESSLALMTPDECEQTYGYRAFVFDIDTVKMIHEYPAIFNPKIQWWVLLSTVPDDKITEKMVKEKFVYDTLRYEAVESDVSISNEGTIAYATEKELSLQTFNDEGPLLPLDERIRRFIFAETTGFTVLITEEDMKQENSTITDTV